MLLQECISQVQRPFIASYGAEVEVDGRTGIPSGMLVDNKGPRPPIMIGAACLFLGYYPIYLGTKIIMGGKLLGADGIR
jgi:hypothetical protein